MRSLLLSLAVLAAPAFAQRVPFEEFQKVVQPRSRITPLKDGKRSLLVLRMPADKYPKLYSLDHATKETTLRLDPGRPVGGLVADYGYERYYFHLDNNGDENTQIYSFDPNTNTYDFVFGHKGFKASIEDFSPDGKRLYIRSNHEDKKSYRIYRYTLENGFLQALTPAGVNFDGFVVDESETHAALVQAFGNNEHHLWLLDLRSGEHKKILSKPATIYDPEFFHPTEPWLYVKSDDGQDRKACARISLSAPEKLEWVRRDPSRDLSCVYRRQDKISLVVEEYDGRLGVRVFEGVLGKEIRTPLPDKAIASQFTLLPGGRRAMLYMLTADRPGEYYEFELAQGAKAELKAISKLNQSSIPLESFASSYDLRWKSYDGMDIHGIVFAQPSWLKDGKRRPVIVWPHGGPDNFEKHAFHPFFQYWALNGYVVFAPNFRGSTGYGKKFETLNDKDWGGGHIKDVIWGKRELAKLDYVDPERVYIVGASFGGFSTLSAITQYPKEFKGAVAIVALANLFTFMKSIPPDPAWQSEFLTEMGDPVKDRALYEERSPFFHADKIAIPLKIYQAENDVRTVKAEMDAFVERMRQAGLPVEYEVLEKEGHGISRQSSWQKVLQGTVEFLEKVRG